MPANLVKPGQEGQWKKAKKLAAERGHGGDYAYIVGIFKRLTDIKKAAVDNPAFKYHTQSGEKIPLPVDDIDEVDVDDLGLRLADEYDDWTAQDHQDAASSHMLAGITARGDAIGWSDYDSAPKLLLARQHIKMSQAHNIASGYCQERGRGGVVVFKSIRRGAGSHGGHIISYTRSGKAVYEPGHGHQINYDKHDHHDAARAHLDVAKKLNAAKAQSKTAQGRGRLRNRILAHLDVAQAHLDAHHVLDTPAAEVPETKPAVAEEPKPADVKEAEEPVKPKRAVKYIKREKVNGKWVYTYPEDAAKKPRKPRLPLKKPEKAAAEPDPPPADNPDREEAAKELDEPGEYQFARDSKFGNKGEDLQLSARHKANAWRGWEDAERQGTAVEMVKRDILMKVAPLDFMTPIEKGNVLPALVGYLALKKFPSAPTHKNLGKLAGKNAADDTPIADLYVDNAGKKHVVYRRYKDTSGRYDDDPAYKHLEVLTKAKMEARNRGEYVKAFEKVQEAVKQVVAIGTPDNWTLGPVRNAVKEVMTQLRAEDRYSDTANALVRYVNTSLQTDGYRAKAHSIQDDLKKVHEYLAQLPADQQASGLLEASKQIVEGKSVDQAFGKVEKTTGTKVEKPKEFTAADAYVTHAVRKGPEPSGVATKAEQEKTLLDAMGIRGLQWGNSVTDDERKHHLKQAAMAFDDLADILGLPKKMVSFNNRLGLAIGARGHGTAMAHYEPTMRVINLTRKNGVGSLAHEWGHFFDNICSELVASKKTGYLTDDAQRHFSFYGATTADHPVTQAMADLFASEPMKGFVQRMNTLMDTKYANSIPYKKRAYWRSTIEVWARCFERHVQTKLESKGRENTYLSGGTNRDLWPDDAESKAMAPYFDKVFEAFKATGLVNKALRLARRLTLMKKMPSTGAGSRGGIVIGRTASGKPIYKNRPSMAAGYTHEDHADAAEAHDNMAQMTEGEDKKHYMWVAKYHAHRAQTSAAERAS